MNLTPLAGTDQHGLETLDLRRNGEKIGGMRGWEERRYEGVKRGGGKGGMRGGKKREERRGERKEES